MGRGDSGAEAGAHGASRERSRQKGCQAVFVGDDPALHSGPCDLRFLNPVPASLASVWLHRWDFAIPPSPAFSFPPFLPWGC